MVRQKTIPVKFDEFEQKKLSWDVKDVFLEEVSNAYSSGIRPKDGSNASSNHTSTFKLKDQKITVKSCKLQNNINPDNQILLRCLDISMVHSTVSRELSEENGVFLHMLIKKDNSALFSLCTNSNSLHTDINCKECVYFIFKENIDVKLLIHCIKKKVFSIQVYNGKVNIFLNINVDKSQIQCSCNVRNSVLECLYNLVCIAKIENISMDTDSTTFSKGIQHVLDNLKVAKEFLTTYKGNTDISHPALNVTLRKYQSLAVQWMLQQEHNYENRNKDVDTKFQEIYKYQDTNKSAIAYLNLLTGNITKQPIDHNIRFKAIHPGGILADEMGLGKTVETIACILLHPRNIYTEEDDAQTKENIFDENSKTLDKIYEELTVCENINDERNVETINTTRITLNLLRKYTTGLVLPNIYDLVLKCFLETPPRFLGYTFIKLCNQICKMSPTFKLFVQKSDVKKCLNLMIANNDVSMIERVNKNKKIQKFYCLRKVSRKKYNMQLKDLKKKIINIEKAYEKYSELNKPNIIKTKRKQIFLTSCTLHCLCGNNDHCRTKNPVVRCTCCQTYQHIDCVDYKLLEFSINQYLCPHCVVQQENTFPSKSTLIISPRSIYMQWLKEIERHINSEHFKVLCYEGIKSSYIQPKTLSQYDIVLTSYDVLQQEIYNTSLPHHCDNKLRNDKLYMATPSPLLGIEWWRVCLDEAQMVGNVAANVSKMASLLPAINRWCVTGTPVSNGLDDLYGLVSFLKVDPITDHDMWKFIIARPFYNEDYKPLCSLLNMILWRNTKSNVISEINIPPQSEVMHYLTNTNVEKYFYNDIYNSIKSDVTQKLNLYNTNNDDVLLSDLSTLDLKSILSSIVKLRQACCDPSITKYFKSLPQYGLGSVEATTMETLLKRLIKKCTLDCEDEHRHAISAQNGLAGLHIIKNQHSSAIAVYRNILKTCDQLKEQVRTDPLQLLHVSYNLKLLLDEHNNEVGPTTRDSNLDIIVKDIEENYLEKHTSVLCSKKEVFEKSLSELGNCKDSPYFDSTWWDSIIEQAVSNNDFEDILIGVENSLNAQKSSDMRTINSKFNSPSSLTYILSSNLDNLMRSNENLTRAVLKLNKEFKNNNFQDKAVACHLPSRNMVNEMCDICKAEFLFIEVESMLFSPLKSEILVQRNKNLTSTNTGLKAKGETEIILYAILSFAKRNRNIYPLPALVKYGNKHMEIFENMKKLYKALHEFWSAIRDYVSGIDELRMAKSRIVTIDESLPSLSLTSASSYNAIESHDMERITGNLEADFEWANIMLETKLSNMRYLKNLEKFEIQKKSCVSNNVMDKAANYNSDENPETCPICLSSLGIYWVMFTCGHCFCIKCHKIWASKNTNQFGTKCAICMDYKWDISYVALHEDKRESEFLIIGNHSTKVKGVIIELMKIFKAEPGAKTIVFSAWKQMLQILSNAFGKNKIKHNLLTTPSAKDYEKNLEEFKTSKNINVLLLPLNIGGKGLNIIEAEHVFLVEPILSKSIESQAVGRVHRIGQTRKTTVHKFVIKGTVEEDLIKMSELNNSESNSAIACKAKSENEKLANISIMSFKKLFI